MRIIALNSDVFAMWDARRYFGWVAPFRTSGRQFFLAGIGLLTTKTPNNIKI